MKNLVLLVSFIFLAASSGDAFSYEVHTKECMKSFESNLRTGKDVSKIKVKKKKKKTVTGR